MTALLIVAGIMSGCSTAPRPATTSPPTDGLTAAGDLGQAIESSPDPDWIAVTDEGAWVANVGPGLVRYDRDGSETATVETDQVIQAMQVAFGRLWLTSTDESTGTGDVVAVSVTDPDDVLRTPLEGATIPPESSLAATEDAVWVHVVRDGSPSLVAIDPTNGAVLREIPGPPAAGAVRALDGSLWVSQPVLRTVSRVDPADGTVRAVISTGPRPTFLFPGAGAMWVLNSGDGSVTRIDPTDDSARVLPASGGPVDGGDIVADDARVWVRTSAELAVELDVESLEVVQRVGPASGSGSIAIDRDQVWISAHDVKTVWHLDGVG